MSLFDRAVVAALPLVPRPLVRRFADPYIAGETLDDALATIRGLGARGIRATLDLLGEQISSIAEADLPREAYLQAMEEIRKEGLDSTISVKPTQLGLSIDREAAYRNIRTLVARGSELGVGVAIDMEDSTCTTPTLDIYRRLRAEFPNVSAVLQAMLRRSPQDARDLAELRPSVRVCKGIYVEPKEIAHQDGALVNRSYMEIVDIVLDAGGFAAFATHDDELVEACLRRIRERKLDPSRYEFQMLLGVREELRDRVVAAGHPLRIYVPYGQQWYAYSIRRMRENPRVAGMVARAVLGMG